MDLLLFESINSLAGHNAVIDGAFVLISKYGQFALVGLLLLLWFWPAEPRVRQDRQRTIIIAGMSVALALLVNQVIIHLWNRPRPFIGHPDRLLLPASKEPSFPSDHSTFGFAIAAALLFGAAPLDLPALLIAGLLAFSRIYTGECCGLPTRLPLLSSQVVHASSRGREVNMCRSALMRTGGRVFILFLMLTLAGCGGVTGSSSNGGGGNGAGPSSGATRRRRASSPPPSSAPSGRAARRTRGWP